MVGPSEADKLSSSSFIPFKPRIFSKEVHSNGFLSNPSFEDQEKWARENNPAYIARLEERERVNKEWAEKLGSMLSNICEVPEEPELPIEARLFRLTQKKLWFMPEFRSATKEKGFMGNFNASFIRSQPDGRKAKYGIYYKRDNSSEHITVLRRASLDIEIEERKKRERVKTRTVIEEQKVQVSVSQLENLNTVYYYRERFKLKGSQEVPDSKFEPVEELNNKGALFHLSRFTIDSLL